MASDTQRCNGCEWDAWTAANPKAGHRHSDQLDGPRKDCCAHTCRKAR